MTQTDGQGRRKTFEEIYDDRYIFRAADDRAKRDVERDRAERAMLGDQQDDDPFARGYVDVAALMRDGLPEAPKPTVLARTDGHFLFYRGEVNVLFGDPDGGKTWIRLCACADVLAAGGRVLIIDLDHNGGAAIVARLLELGAPSEAVCDFERCRVFTPEDDAELYRAVGDCVREGGWVPDVAGIDSVGELLPKLGLNSDRNDDFTIACQRVFYKFAGTGAAVVLVDHLAKSYDSRQFGATGAGAKKRAVGGVQIRVVAKTPFRKGVGGRAQLYVNKDRHGGVREHCPPPPSGKPEEWAGTFVLEDAGGSLLWTVEAPPSDPSADKREFRPTHLMEKASKVVEEHPGEFTRDKIATEAGGTKKYTLAGIDALFKEEYVVKDDRHYPRYTSVKPYREADDPKLKPGSSDLGDRLREHAQAQPEEVPDAPGEG